MSLLFPCTKQLLTAINNKVKSTLESTPALYYKFYRQMNYELISLTELNPKILGQHLFSFVIMCAKGQGWRMARATMTHIRQLYGTAHQISHS